MLFFVTGPPGCFTEVCEAIVVRFVQSAFGAAGRTGANSLDEIARSLLRNGSSHGVVAAHQAGGRLRRALIETDRPFVVALEDPRVVLADLVLRRGVALPTATRMVASSCAAALCLRDAPGALVLDSSRDGDRVSLATAIARHLQLDADAGEIAEIASGLDQNDATTVADAAVTWWTGLDEAERAIANGALGPYLEPDAATGSGPVIWAPGLFFVGDRPTEHIAGSIDITGRVRCLLRGPQILLPPGSWSLSAEFDVSPETTEHRFLLEITAGAVIGRTSIEPRAAGTIRAELDLVLEELPDQPIDLALSNERPAFAGHLRLLGVTLTRQPPAVPMVDTAESKEPEPAGS